MLWRCEAEEGVLWAKILPKWKISIVEAVTATVFHQFPVTERRTVKDVVETALLLDTMKFKIVEECNPFSTIIIHARKIT